MTADHLKTATLDDAEKYIYIAQCPCGRQMEIDLVKLREKYGPHYMIRKLRTKLKCECGRKDSIISFNTREWSFVGKS